MRPYQVLPHNFVLKFTSDVLWTENGQDATVLKMFQFFWSIVISPHSNSKKFAMYYFYQVFDTHFQI